MKQNKILNIGPCYTKGAERSGGIVVLFENWKEYCKKNIEGCLLIDSNKSNYSSKIYALLTIVYKCIKYTSKVECVMLHGTLLDYQWLAPIVVCIAKHKHKKVYLRKFAGNFWIYYDSQKGLKRKLIDYALSNSEILFWETHQQVTYFTKKFSSKQSLWFTNVRNRQIGVRPAERPYEKKFVYLSRVERMKGLEQLKEAFNKLGASYRLDIYGPLEDYKLSDFENGNYTYKGSVPSEKVNETLSHYDVLILPTYWRTEGYPGIIIECYNAGIPVIASNVGGIPELIEEGKNGFLIEPESTQAIIDSVRTFDTVDYASMSKNALQSFDQYDADIVNNKIMSILNK